MLQDILQGAIELVFPDNCLLCRQFLNSRHQRQLCTRCLGSLAFNPNPFKMPRHLETHAFDHAWAVCLYNETAQELLHAFKYGSKTSLRKTFVPLMIDYIERHHIPLGQFDCISPIPLHPVKERERGYNQSALLSQGICQHYEIPYRENLLVRQKRTRTQTELGAKQRWTNMEGAFRIKNLADVRNKKVLLIDDLLTTGATAHNAATAITKAGAAQASILTFCVAI